MKNPFTSTAQPQTPLAWLALIRMLVGLVIVTTWGSNLLKGFYTPDGLVNFFTNIFPQADNPLGWYAGFINNVILPAGAAFAPFQLVGEFLLGFCLLAGLFTPWSSVIAAFFILNTFLATFGHDWPWSYGMILGMLFVVFWTRAGRSLGLDAWLQRRFGESPLPFLW